MSKIAISKTMPPKSVKTSAKRAIIGASVGTAIDWYDFFIFGTAAALFFPRLFFPDFDPLVGTLLSLGTFSVAFIARPLGAAVFGHLGDRVGRKNILVVNLLIMGAGTTFIGLLPTYDSIGVAAPVLLLVLRFFQGFGLGGEYGGAMSLAAEHAPKNRRGYYGAWVEMACPAGLVMASTTVLVLVSTLSDDAIFSWGWRVPFLLSVALIIVGLVIRLKVTESPTFSQVADKVHKSPLTVLFKDYLGQTLKAGAIWLAVNTCFYLAAVFVVSYGTNQLSMTYETVLLAVVGAAIVAIVICVWAGHLSDRYGRKRIGVIGSISMIVVAFPSLALIDAATPVSVFLGTSLILGATFMVAGLVPAYFSEMFDTRVRYSGVSVSIALGTLLGGGAAPSLAAALLIWHGGSSWGIALMILVSGLISIVSFLLIKKSYPVTQSDEMSLPETQRNTSSELSQPALER